MHFVVLSSNGADSDLLFFPRECAVYFALDDERIQTHNTQTTKDGQKKQSNRKGIKSKRKGIITKNHDDAAHEKNKNFHSNAIHVLVDNNVDVGHDTD